MRASLIGLLTAATLIAAPGSFNFMALAEETNVIGVWRLVLYKRQNPTTGEVLSKEFSDNSGGSLVYTEGGRMLVLLKAAMLVTYAGRFTVVGDRIIHHVELSNIPDFVGLDLERAVAVSGNRMTLKAESIYSDTKYTLVWERIE
jgi:hypothetical protein